MLDAENINLYLSSVLWAKRGNILGNTIPHINFDNLMDSLRLSQVRPSPLDSKQDWEGFFPSLYRPKLSQELN